MAIVLSILRKSHAMGTHHQLALDALSGLAGADAQRWERLFYKHIVHYLDGAKAPDKAFKDFQNHVLHPRYGFWGGAVAQAETWYDELVGALSRQEWPAAVYAAGVLSHYCSDPLQPLHTHQTEAENSIHAAVEWSVSRSYSDLRRLGLTLGRPEPDGRQSIEALLHEGAQRATAHYETTLAHYDIKRGVVAPEEGFDAVGRMVMAEMLVVSAQVVAIVLQRAISTANVAPPDVALAGDALKAFLTLPASRRRRNQLDADDRRMVEAMYDELMASGRVDKTLPEDERMIRDLYEAALAAGATASSPAAPAAAVDGAAPAAAVDGAAPAAASSDAVPVAAPTAPAEGPASGHLADEASAPEEDRLDPEDPADAYPRPRVRLDVERPHPAPLPTAAPAIRSRSAARDAVTVDTAALTPAAVSPLAALGELRPISIAPPASATPASALASYRPSAGRGRAPLSLEADIVDAPSIGPKTAQKLNAVGIDTVGDFLNAHPIALAARLESIAMSAQVLTEWQDQARLMSVLGELRAGDAKLLVGSGYRTLAAITNVDADQLAADILRFALTKDGQALLRDGHVPDVEKIRGWADEARAVKAA